MVTIMTRYGSSSCAPQTASRSSRTRPPCYTPSTRYRDEGRPSRGRQYSLVGAAELDDINDVYKYHGIDADSIVRVALDVVAPR